MEITINQNEIAFVQTEFPYKKLYGVKAKLSDKENAQKTLEEKGLIHKVKGFFELSDVFRLLFESWKNVRFVMKRADLCDEDHELCLLSDEREIIYYMRDKDSYVIRFVDVDPDILTLFIASCMQLGKIKDPKDSYNVKVDKNQLNLIIEDGCESALAKVAKETGLPVAWLGEYKKEILSVESETRSHTLTITEDLKSGIRFLTKLVKTENAIYAFKKQEKDEAGILIKGGTNFVADCMCNF